MLFIALAEKQRERHNQERNLDEKQLQYQKILSGTQQQRKEQLHYHTSRRNLLYIVTSGYWNSTFATQPHTSYTFYFDGGMIGLD